MSEDPLVLLPGMNCSARLWHELVPRLQKAEPEIEIRHGALNQASVQESVTELLDTLPRRFSLAGLSLGGVTALAMVRRAPQRVARLCLMSTNPHAPTPDQHAAWNEQRRQLAQGRTARDLQRELLPVLVSPSARSPQLDEQILAMADDTGTDRLDRQLAAQSTRIDERPTLSRLRVPTLLLSAEKDALVGVARHQEAADLTSYARLTVLPGAGHLSSLEAPDQVAVALIGWMSESGDSSTPA